MSFIFYSAPYFIFTDPYTLKFLQAIGQAIGYISFLYQALILWHMGFRSKLPKYVLLIPTAILGLLGTYLDFQAKQVYQVSPGVLNWARPQTALWLEVFFIIVLILPIGLLFIKEAIGQKEWAARAKSLGIGLAYFGVGIAQIMQDIVEEGVDKVENGLAGLIFFSLLLIILILPTNWIRHKAFQTNR